MGTICPRSNPPPHPRFVVQVLVAELAFQVALLALYNPAPHDVEDDGEQQRRGECVGEITLKSDVA